MVQGFAFCFGYNASMSLGFGARILTLGSLPSGAGEVLIVFVGISEVSDFKAV